MLAIKCEKRHASNSLPYGLLALLLHFRCAAWRKVYGLASSFGVEMSVHQQPQMAAHLMAATPHGEKHGIEIYMPDADPYFHEMIENQTPIENGKYRLPEGPGFGYVYDEKVIAKYRHDA